MKSQMSSLPTRPPKLAGAPALRCLLTGVQHRRHPLLVAVSAGQIDLSGPHRQQAGRVVLDAHLVVTELVVVHVDHVQARLQAAVSEDSLVLRATQNGRSPGMGRGREGEGEREGEREMGDGEWERRE